MKGKKSAGILLFKILDTELKVLLVHPGGPFWAKKEQGAWSIPKGEFQIDEEPLKAAQKEFFEETGEKVEGDFIELGSAKLKSGKLVFCWALQRDFIVEKLISNTCEVVWPPRSGKIISIPEIDRAAWFSIEQAMEYINEGQQPFLIRLLEHYEVNNK
ncbi:MAG: NUDIX domain-containing protein [Ginsengibacter sp.]